MCEVLLMTSHLIAEEFQQFKVYNNRINLKNHQVKIKDQIFQ